MSLVLATGSYDYTIKFWDPCASGSTEQIRYATNPKFIVNKIQISEDKGKLAASFSNCAKIYDINKNNAVFRSFDNFNGNVTSIGFQKDCKWIHTACEDGSIKILDLRKKTEARCFKTESAINTSVLHPNEVELISGDQSGSLKVFDLTADKLKSELPSKNEIGIRSLSISINAKFLMSCDSAGFVYPYYLENTQHLVPSKPFKAHEDYILKIQIALNNKYVATCSADRKIMLWALKPTANERDLQFEPFKCLKGHNKWVWDCDFSCDSAYLISASTDTTVRLWDVQTGEIVQILKGHLKGIVCLALNDIAT